MVDKNNPPKELSFEKLNAGLELISRKWQPLIVYLLTEKGQLGFNQIKEHLGEISGKVLSESLKDLEEKGIVSKKVISKSPKRVKYSITQKGQDMKPVLEGLLDWGDKYVDSDDDYKILVIDDEEKLADIYTKWLESFYEVETAYSGEDGLDALDEDVKLVLLDRMLPGMSGKQVLQAMRDTRDDIYVVMLTAKDPEIDVANLEIDDYIVKPVTQEELTRKVEETLAREEKDDLKRELEALTSKKELLNQKFSDEDLEGTEDYRELVGKINQLKHKLAN